MHIQGCKIAESLLNYVVQGATKSKERHKVW